MRLSKVTIKFWDKDDGQYYDDKAVDCMCFVIDRHGKVFENGQDDFVLEHIDPHFYKDGERIA